MAEVETIAERFSLAVVDKARELEDFAKGSSEDREALLDCIGVLEELEYEARELRDRLVVSATASVISEACKRGHHGHCVYWICAQRCQCACHTALASQSTGGKR